MVDSTTPAHPRNNDHPTPHIRTYVWSDAAIRRLRGSRVRSNADAVHLVLHWRKQGYIRTHYRHSFLYVYRADFDGSGTLYKIGVSQDPGRRAKTLAYWQVPQGFVFLQWTRDAYALEAGLHDQFRARRRKPESRIWRSVQVSGKTEWFDLSPGELREIGRLADVWSLVAPVVEGGASCNA